MPWVIRKKVSDELKVRYPHAPIFTSTVEFILLTIQTPICVLSKCLFSGACWMPPPGWPTQVQPVPKRTQHLPPQTWCPCLLSSLLHDTVLYRFWGQSWQSWGLSHSHLLVLQNVYWMELLKQTAFTKVHRWVPECTERSRKGDTPD